MQCDSGTQSAGHAFEQNTVKLGLEIWLLVLIIPNLLGAECVQKPGELFVWTLLELHWASFNTAWFTSGVS